MKIYDNLFQAYQLSRENKEISLGSEDYSIRVVVNPIQRMQELDETFEKMSLVEKVAFLVGNVL